jgi:hypothetical protein
MPTLIAVYDLIDKLKADEYDKLWKCLCSESISSEVAGGQFWPPTTYLVNIYYFGCFIS